MHRESRHEQQRGTGNHGAADLATDDHDIGGTSRAATRSPARDRAFAALLAEATFRGADTLRGYDDELGLITPIMP